MAKIELKEVVINGKKILIRANDEEFNSKLNLKEEVAKPTPVVKVEKVEVEEEEVVLAPKASKKK